MSKQSVVTRITYLEDVGEIPEVEDVVELDGGGQEGCGHLVVERQRTLDQVRRELLHGARKARLGEMLTQDAGVDGGQGVLVGEADGEHAEVSLE